MQNVWQLCSITLRVQQPIFPAGLGLGWGPNAIINRFRVVAEVKCKLFLESIPEIGIVSPTLRPVLLIF